MNEKKMSIWSNTGAESGILRKNDQRDKKDDLLVFGYACKLFRDDEKALEIDQGKHLIPWMADNTLKIDRYDGRGTLSDLFPYEASKEGFDAQRWLGLSESERKLEQLCDEERYHALHTNEEEEELYKEEELKRAQIQSNQIQYNYEEPPKTEGPTLPTEEDDEPFIPPPDLDVPVGMVLPSTMRQNARIEKTALFISKEGPQMEILLKTKQSRNPQFAFLTQDDELFRYYRHILMAIKTGRYKITSDSNKPDDESKEEMHYLHPSLACEVNSMQPVASFPPLTYKPSANCAYSRLIQRIQGTQPTPDTSTTSNLPENAGSSVQNIYNHPAYIQHFQQYGYYPQYDQSHPYFAQFTQYQEYQHTSSNPYAQIVSNLKTKDDQNVQNDTKTEITKAPVLYGLKSEVMVDVPMLPTVQTVAKTAQKPLFALAEYSDSENEDDEENSESSAVVVPPNEIQIIVDKMAAYVAKNGADFEAIVKSKGDPRFIFLEENHLYHPYYKYKLKECLQKGNKNEKKDIIVKTGEENKVEKEDKNVEKTQEEKNEKKVAQKPKEKKVITPVCFSIKKPQTNSESVSRDKSALPIEDSTDDEEQVKNDPETAACGGDNQSEAIIEEKQEENKNIIEIEDPIMELIDLTDELEEKRDKRAEDRLKDKIAAAAREKLAEKNRALQLERKKRAAAFLSQLKPRNEVDEVKTVRLATPEPGEIITSDSFPPEDLSRLVYHIEPSASPKNDGGKNLNRSRSSSRHRHKTSHHRRKSHKRSHSHSRKRKRDRRSHDRKKSKKRYHSKSRSRTRSPRHHRTEKKEESSDAERQKSRKRREKSLESSYSSEYDSDTNVEK